MKKANSKKMLKKDEHLISIIYRPLTKKIASILLKLGVTPNPVSHSIIITALIGGIFFSFGDYKSLVIGAIFSQLSLICDLLDGMIARARNAKTMFGRWYERITNKVMKYFLVLGASIGAYKTSGDPTILIIGAMAIFNITTISFISNMRLLFDFSKDYNELPRTKKFFIPFGMATTTMLTIAALFNKVSWFLWFFAIFGTLAWIKQIYSHYKMGNHIKIENK